MAAPAARRPSKPMGRPSEGVNSVRSCSFSRKEVPTSGTRRSTFAPLPRYSAWP